jgi:hypothetical protein
MLPRAPADAGYYVYGQLNNKPSHGEYQYAHPSMMTTILRVEGNGKPSTSANLVLETSASQVAPRTRITGRT